MCKWGTTVPVEVIVPADQSHTGQDRPTTKPIDACIAPLVEALNEAGIRTDGSCCGHGKADGWIALHDGRKLTISVNDRRNCVPGGEGDKAEPSAPKAEEAVAWLVEMSESDVAGCHELTAEKPTPHDHDYGLTLRHLKVVGSWMTYDEHGVEVEADQGHRTCVSIDHCAARNALAPPEPASHEIEEEK